MPDHDSVLLTLLSSVGAKQAAAVILERDDSVAPIEVPSVPSTVTVSNIWRHPQAHPVALDLFMLRKYGPDWLGWEAETLRAIIPPDFKTSSVSEINIAKLQACKTLHMVDSFWNSWEVYVACLAPFNSEFPDFEIAPAPTVAQCLVACDVGARIRDDVEWSSEMKVYVSTVYEHDGIFLPLPPADFVTLKTPPEINPTELALKWPEVRARGRAPTAATPLDEQLRRLLAAHEYLEGSRSRLQQQLHLHV